MSSSRLPSLGVVLGLATWAVVLGMRLNPVTDVSRLKQSAPDPGVLPIAPSAERLYETSCASCHQSEGQGRFPVFPPLAASPWVTGDASRLAALTLHGMSGPVDVNGAGYSGLMPGFDHLSDAELASVLSYVRRSWGNSASPLSEAEVASLRARTSNRELGWTAADLDAWDSAR